MITAMAALILLRGTGKGCDVYAAFLRGAERGMRSAMQLMPVLCAMLLMLAVFRSSGASNLLTMAAAPLTGMLHIPQEVTPILLLRPFTGSGSLAALRQIYESCGVDSRAGMIASVLMGSTETIFYTMTVYLGAAGISRLRWVLPVSMAAYAAGTMICCMIVT